MNKFWRNFKVGLIFGILLLCVGMSLVHLLGALFFLATSTFWTFVPPLVLLGLIALMPMRSLNLRLIYAYALVLLFILSYVFERWQLVLDRYASEGFYLFPDLAETILVVSLVVLLHCVPGKGATLGDAPTTDAQ